ncbi:hypothetical protein [Bacteroides xylanisolvens]|uniref:hypothetical protein n=3 Tax=Bacteroidales TaxID=171549 RepID=UPI001F037C52|nr:hypothetical protein [Bacteroides xylanisolvens]
MQKMDRGIVSVVLDGGRQRFFLCRLSPLPLLPVSGFLLFSAENPFQKTFLLLRRFFPGNSFPGMAFLYRKGTGSLCRLPAHLPDNNRNFLAHRLADALQFVKRAHGCRQKHLFLFEQQAHRIYAFLLLRHVYKLSEFLQDATRLFSFFTVLPQVAFTPDACHFALRCQFQQAAVSLACELARHAQLFHLAFQLIPFHTFPPEQINDESQQQYQHGITYKYFKLQSHSLKRFVLFLVPIRFSALRAAPYAHQRGKKADGYADEKHSDDYPAVHSSSSFPAVAARCLTSTIPPSCIVKKTH